MNLFFFSRLGLNKIYNRMLLTFLQKVVVKNRKSLEKLNIDVDFLLNNNQMKDFDEFI